MQHQKPKLPAGRIVPAKPVPMKEKPIEAKKEAVRGKPVEAVPSEAMLRVRAMAEKAAAWKPFADACKQQGYADPVRAFLKFYDRVKNDPLIWKREARVEEQMEDKGLRFSRAGFYAKLFIDAMKAGKTGQ